MKISKKIKVFAASLLMLVSLPFSAITAAASSSYGHSNCVFPGSWYDNKQADLMIYVRSSAITTQTPKTTYNAITQWNNISSKVHVNVAFPVDQVSLYGKSVIYRDESLSSGVKGNTILYDANGNVIFAANLTSSSRINNVGIQLKISGFFDKDKNFDAEFAKKTIIHEVGHALLLRHPDWNGSLSGHTIYGVLPLAIMNQGSLASTDVSNKVEAHDKNELIYKWGA